MFKARSTLSCKVRTVAKAPVAIISMAKSSLAVTGNYVVLGNIFFNFGNIAIFLYFIMNVL